MFALLIGRNMILPPPSLCSHSTDGINSMLICGFLFSERSRGHHKHHTCMHIGAQGVLLIQAECSSREEAWCVCVYKVGEWVWTKDRYSSGISMIYIFKIRSKRSYSGHAP